MANSRLCLYHTGAIRGFRWILGSLLLIVTCLAACAACNPTPTSVPSPSPLKDCVDFEDLKVGNKYQKLATWASSGAAIQVLNFQWSNMNWTSDGYAEVMQDGLAGGAGNEMFLNNVNLGLDIGSTECVTIHFHNKGGNVNLIINDTVGNWDDFQNANLGGVIVSADYVGNENKGTLTLSGEFKRFNFQEKGWISFAIGGQELFIDDICPCRY